MRDFSLHLLDITENSIAAGATRVEIVISQDIKQDRMLMSVCDNGKGIDLERKRGDAYFTEKEGKRFGLGIPFLGHAAELCDGALSIRRRAGGGTEVAADFRLSHIDLKPLGDMGATMITMIGAHPEMDFHFRFSRDDSVYELDTDEIRAQLDGIALNNPTVLQVIRDNVNNGIRRVKDEG